MRPESRREQAARLRAKGRTVNEIADTMGIAVGTVKSHIRHAAKRGQHTKVDPGWKMIEKMPDEIRVWIGSITPKGASPSDTIRAIITDAYAEEHK